MVFVVHCYGHGGAYVTLSWAVQRRSPSCAPLQASSILGLMALTFQDMIAWLQAYWAYRAGVVMQPYHTEVGAGTSNPATVLRCLGHGRGAPSTSSRA